MYDVLPWESVPGHGPEREPESASAAANRHAGDDRAWSYRGVYVANPSTAARAKQLDAERAERGAARRAEWEAREALREPLFADDADVIAAEIGAGLAAAVAADLIAAALELRTAYPARRAA